GERGVPPGAAGDSRLVGVGAGNRRPKPIPASHGQAVCPTWGRNTKLGRMKKLSRVLVSLVLLAAGAALALAADGLQSLPPLTPAAARAVASDWLIAPTGRKAGVYRGESGKEIVMTN